MNSTEIKEITKTDIQEVRDVLKKYSNAWAKQLASLMYPGQDEDEALDKVYNITNGRTRDQDIRRHFINCAAELQHRLQAEQKESIDKLNNIKQNAHE